MQWRGGGAPGSCLRIRALQPTPCYIHFMQAVRILLGVPLIALVATPSLARAADAPCAEVRFDGDYRLKIPCPPGTRLLLEHIPRPAKPPRRQDDVIDPDWPHDQAMIREHDWPHDMAMIAPQQQQEEEPAGTAPLLDELLGLIEPYLSEHPDEEVGRDPPVVEEATHRSR